MSDRGAPIAATFVEPRGTVRSVVAGVAGGELTGGLGRLLSVLELTFADGSTWAFDVPKIHLSGAMAITQTLS